METFTAHVAVDEGLLILITFVWLDEAEAIRLSRPVIDCRGCYRCPVVFTTPFCPCLRSTKWYELDQFELLRFEFALAFLQSSLRTSWPLDRRHARGEVLYGS